MPMIPVIPAPKFKSGDIIYAGEMEIDNGNTRCPMRVDEVKYSVDKGRFVCSVVSLVTMREYKNCNVSNFETKREAFTRKVA